MHIIEQVIHYFLHFIFPGIVAYVFLNGKWKRVYVVFLLTMLVDADHLLSTPFFHPCRCSIGFHPLHSYIAIVIYALLFFFPKFRIVSVGLLMHMATDYIDCIFITHNCN
jgi:hypothetical protein